MRDTNTSLGQVTEVLPNMLYRVQMKDGPEILAYLAGKMRVNKIQVIVGDRVEVVLDPHGGKATNRVVRRLK